MQITQRTWPYLLLKFLKGTISKPEREQLDLQRAASPMKEEQFQKVTSPRWMITLLKDYHRLHKEESGDRVLIADTVPETLAWEAPVKFNMNWAAMAACLAGIALVATWLLWPVEKTVTPISDSNAALPNRAMLILADKTSFVLNDVKDGLLVKDGSSSIFKKNGVLILKGPTLFKDSVAQMNELVLPEGSPYKLQLPDGSLVTMLASSRIRFPTHFSAKARLVEIEGEGYLHIVKNPAVPFIVNLRNDYSVRVFGTSFYVSAYPTEDSTRVKLVEGAVRISKLTGVGKFTDLLPDHQFIGSKGRDTVVAVTQARADLEAWEEDQFNLNKDLRTILQDIAHWYGMTVDYPSTIANPALHGGLDRNQSLQQALERLQKSITVKIRLTGKTISVSQ